MSNKKLAVILPGIGYNKDMPLLYYARKLVQSRGYEVMHIEYHDLPRIIKGDAAMMKKAAEIAYSQTEEQLSNVDFSDLEDVVFIGKSLGTVVLAKYIADHSITARQIWYTPVEDTFSFPAKDVVAFIGEEDPLSDVSVLKEKANDLGIKLYSYPKANHSLETGNVRMDIMSLREVMDITEGFITRRL